MGLAIGSKLVSFAARTLPLPELVYGPPRDPGTLARKKGYKDGWLTIIPHGDRANWNLENVGFAKPYEYIGALHVLGLKHCFDAHVNRDPNGKDIGTSTRLVHCIEDFTSQLRGHDVRVDPALGYQSEQKHATITGELKGWFDECRKDDCTLILLQEKDYGKYSTIKRYADLNRGCYTVCAVGRKIVDRDSDKKLSRYQVLSNLALKVNMKMGGDNHFLQFAPLDAVLGGEQRTKTTMICGADVTHPGSGGKLGCPSIACVVGSVDRRFMNYPGSMRLQAGRQEVSAVSRIVSYSANSI